MEGGHAGNQRVMQRTGHDTGNPAELSGNGAQAVGKAQAHNNGLGAGKTPVTFEATTALREAAEYKGYTVTWNAEDGSIALTKGNDTVTITLGSGPALKNGQEVALTTAPYAEDGVTYVPMSLIQSL